MKTRWIVLIAVMLAVLGAQTVYASCTFGPVKVGSAYTTRDDGSGPIVTYLVNNVSYNPGTINVAAGTVSIGPDYESGYVDIFGGWGGCYVAWSYELLHKRDILDVTANQIIHSEYWQGTAMNYCGYVPSCHFAPAPNPFIGTSINVPLTSGHTYAIRDYLYVLTNYQSTQSQIYTTYLYLKAQ